MYMWTSLIQGLPKYHVSIKFGKTLRFAYLSLSMPLENKLDIPVPGLHSHLPELEAVHTPGNAGAACWERQPAHA